MTPPDKTAPTARIEHPVGATGNAEMLQSLYQQGPGLGQQLDPAARAKSAIAELFKQRDALRSVAAENRKQAAYADSEADAIEKELRALGQNPRPRAPRVKKGEVAK